MSENLGVPVCPGCHFGCLVSDYRCGRGKMLHERWSNGESVPERRMPPTRRSEGASKDSQSAHAPSIDMRIMHGLNIVANIQHNLPTESAERKVLMAVGRQGGFFSCSMLGKRTFVESISLEQAISSLVSSGLAQRDFDEIAGAILRITPAGEDQLRKWNDEREAATAEFLSALDSDDKVQFADMLFRIVQTARENGQKGSHSGRIPK